MYPDRFSSDFENNKHVLDELKLIDKKITRNKLAGYVTCIMKRKSV